MELTHLSLFSGIGGIDIAAEWAGFKTICFVEIDKYCQKVLKKHWPDVPLIKDVKDVTEERIQEIMAYTARLRWGRRDNGDARGGGWALQTQRPSTAYEPVIPTLISGGFPCQPHSVAGKREGSTDERNLWPEFRRVIGEIKPRWVLAENVSGLFSTDARRYFGVILSELAEMGYSTGWATYGAVDVGALHRRNRIFIVGYTEYAGRDATEIQRSIIKRGNGSKTGEKSASEPEGPSEQSGTLADTAEQGLERRRIQQETRLRRRQPCASSEPKCEECQEFFCESCTFPNTNQARVQGYRGLRECGGQWFTWWGSQSLKGIWESEPDVGRVAYGVPSRVDRLKGLGNAVVPQQIYPIFKGIADIEVKR